MKRNQKQEVRRGKLAPLSTKTGSVNTHVILGDRLVSGRGLDASG
jgi:hypothetical protein